MNTKQSLSLSVAFISLLAFAGCGNNCGDHSKDDNAGKKAQVVQKTSSAPAAPAGDILLRIDGQPVVTVSEFEDYRNKVLDIQPQYKQMMAMMPEAEKIKIDQNLYENLVNQKILQAWIEKNDIDDSAAYQKDLALIVDFAKQNLSVKHFQEHHPVQVSKSDVQKFYEESKTKMPGLAQSPGGVNAQAVKFTDKAAATDFLTQVKAPNADFAQVAKAANVKVEDFNNVNDKSFNLDMQVRNSLLAMDTFPQTELVTAGKATWVVQATAKEEPTYVAFDQVQEGLTDMLKQQKQTELIKAEIDKLKEEYDIDSNALYFTKKLQVAQAAAQQQAEKLAAAQKQNEQKVKVAENKSAPSAAPITKAL